MAKAYLEELAKELQQQFADSADSAGGGGKRKPAGAFDRILRKFRAQAHSPREQGTLFEKLCQLYFSLDGVYSLRYSKVEPYATWAGKHGLLGQDTGVDLVATLRNTPKGKSQFCAIQCKFYKEGTALNRRDIDSFLVKSNTAHFVERLIVDTTGEQFSKNMQETIDRQDKPVMRVGLNRLRNSSIEWEYVLAAGIAKQREAKKMRDYQKGAIKKTIAGFKRADRGKLLMACATGKTLTALKIAEAVAGKGGRVLFLAPSLALISQSIRDWCNDASLPLLCYAVCSDSAVGKTEDDKEKSWFGVSDLEIPASTSARALANGIAANKAQHKESMVVVFSTYHSIQRVIDAQKYNKLGEFDLVVCDEAHRTTGVTLEGKDESEFVKVHDAKKLRAKKRLYMTATPRIYGEDLKQKQKDGQIELCSMDDAAKYGEVFEEISFDKAVGAGVLTDYKVVLLQIDKSMVSEDLANYIEGSEFKLDDVALTFGCFRALAKIDIGRQEGEKKGKTPNALWRALAFCKNIKISKNTITPLFESVAEQAAKMEAFKKIPLPGVEARHIDGTDGAVKREQELAWLAQGGADDNCHVLCNVRCLSEGVDVPNLDAVLFMHPRRSKIEVVQSVGRVMRKAEGKKMGYIVLPVVVQPGESVDEKLEKAQYKLIWQVLNALRAHDERLDSELNAVQLGEGVVSEEPRWLADEEVMVTNVGKHIEVISVVKKLPTTDDELEIKTRDNSDQTPTQTDEGAEQNKKSEEEKARTMRLFDHHLALKTNITNKCGTRMYWADWAKDIARIAQAHILRIEAALKNPEIRAEFDAFLAEIHRDINEEVTKGEAVEMLAQHLVTKPVFDALFKPKAKKSEFARNNPVSQAMDKVLAKLRQTNIEKESESLQKFYDSVKRRVKSIESAAAKQKLVKELYDNFFRQAFPRMTERLGIVYTPVEVVDFIIHSVNDVLRQEFNQTLGGKNVRILDPFTGTGTFIVRLLEQSDIISAKQLRQKYNDGIHANEILLLAYYVAAVNIEQAYMGRTGEYKPFPGICLTDTFQLSEGEGGFKGFLKDNSRRRIKQREEKIRVILGNPPYSVGQRDENDNAKNVKYENLDKRIAGSYVKDSNATNHMSLYDSYIRAIRWASDRIENNGVVAFVTGAGWLDGTAHDGMRKHLAEEYSSLYIFNLRGDARLKGELWRKEGGKIFGGGSRAPITINIFVKNPDKKKKHGKIHYHDIGDYLTREEKLVKISAYKSIAGIKKASWKLIKPNANHDWINQRDRDFSNLVPLADKLGKEVFSISSMGLKTNRDAWAYNFSQNDLMRNMKRMINFYNDEVSRYLAACQNNIATPEVANFIDKDKTKISWTRSLKKEFAHAIKAGKSRSPEKFDLACLRVGMYRPFTKRWAFFSRKFNEEVYQQPRLFPNTKAPNRVICVSGNGAADFTALMTDCLPDIQLGFNTICFPFRVYTPQGGGRTLLHESMQAHTERDGITDWMLAAVRKIAGNKTSKEDIFYYVYGVLHAPDYREKYANNLTKELPRIPLPKSAAQFSAFAKAGRALADLHIGYETAKEYPLKLSKTPNANYRVEKMRWLNKQKTELQYNDGIRITDIPPQALQYVVNGRSPVEWVAERQGVSVHKESGIQNDANHYAATTKDGEKYPLKLIARAITVAIETQKIIAALPPLLK